MISENHRTEFKRELTDNLEKEIVAFLNAREGGLVLVGVDNSGRAVGVEKIDQVQLIIKDRLKNNIQPSIMGLFEIAQEQIDGLDVLRITVASGLEKPYYLKKYGMTEKGCFLRVGSAAEPMPQEMIDALYSSRVRNTIGRMESTRLDLSFEQLKIYYQERGLALNSAFLKNLELLTPDGKPNYAAYLLADDNGVSIQVAKYADGTRVHLVENIDFGRCSLIKAYKNVIDRMNVENTIYTRIGVPLREEQQMINRIAMREAVVNAIVHNDYSNGSTPKFEFFSDRLEISSAGGLPYGLDLDDFFAGHSAPRNKEIMRVFRDLEIVEHLGSGIPRILAAYSREAFTISRNFVRLVFPYADKLATTPTQSSDPVTDPVTDPVRRLLQNLLDGPLSAGNLRDRLQLSHRHSFRENYLHAALEQGLIEMTIPTKPNSRLQQYRLTAKGQRLVQSVSKET